jgi:hypothetical protein
MFLFERWLDISLGNARGLAVYEALVAGGIVDEGFMPDQEAVTCNPASFMFRMFLDSLKFIIFMQLGFSSNGTSFGGRTV